MASTLFQISVLALVTYLANYTDDSWIVPTFSGKLVYVKIMGNGLSTLCTPANIPCRHTLYLVLGEPTKTEGRESSGIEPSDCRLSHDMIRVTLWLIGCVRGTKSVLLIWNPSPSVFSGMTSEISERLLIG